MGLYALLTGRRPVLINQASDLPLQDPVEVILLRARALCPDLLHRIYNPSFLSGAGSPAFVPGIITGLTSRAIRIQILKAILYFLAGTDQPRRRLEIFPDADLDYIATETRVMIGANAAPTEVARALSEPLDLVTITTHADGIDMRLTPGSTLCVVKSRVAASRCRPFPRCVKSGICHRYNLPLQNAIRSPELIGCDKLIARIAIINACYALVFSNFSVSQQWGLLFRLLRDSLIGAVVCRWEIVFTSPGDLPPLLTRLTEGDPIGRAVGHYNVARRKYLSFFAIFGDPRLRLPKGSKVGVSQHGPTERRPAMKFASPRTLNPDFALYQAIHSETATAQQAKSAEGELSQSYSATEAQDLLVQIFKDRGKLIDLIFKHGCLVSGDYGTVCKFCSKRTKIHLWRPNLSNSSDRRLITCARCGLLEDSPVDHSFSVHLSAGSVCLAASLSEKWRGVVQFRAYRPEYGSVQDWPRDQNGVLLRQWTPEAPESLGPFTLTCLFLSGYQYSCFSRIL